METLLLFIAADILATHAISQYQIRARKQLIQRWKEGSLTLAELYRLKRSDWFQRTYYKGKKESVSCEKKDN